MKNKNTHQSESFVMQSKRAGIPVFLLLMGMFLFFSDALSGQQLKVNELGYFEARGVNVMVFSNQYNGMFFDEKTAGIEIIHHGVRTSTGGAVRLQNTPEQWDLIPTLVERKVDKEKNSIEVTLNYADFDFKSRVLVTAKDKGVEIEVYLDQPLPEKLGNRAGFNLEFLPSAYFEKTYLIDGNPGEFPLYPAGDTKSEPSSDRIPQFAGHTTFDDRGKGDFISPEPLASGKIITLAPEDPERMVKIQSDAGLMLFDGRNLAQNGWFIVRSILPSKKTGKVLSWYLEANAVPDWKRKPVIGFSQVGYHPAQQKIGVIELDKSDTPLKFASLWQVSQDGETIEKMKAEVKSWGPYLRYNYARFDFSALKEPGLYYIVYGEQRTNAFPISTDVYKEVWYPTMDVWFPVQMDHMKVNEAYRVWHGVSYLDDALQAPVNHQHFDGYSMGPVTDTKYKDLERIPGMAVGGWYDAGDFDIQTGSHNAVILNLVDAWEKFALNRDVTYIDQAGRFVDIHRPDGKPDILQQIEHGTLNLVAQCENIGHPVRGIIVPNLHQYHHLGDASQESDNLPYNPNLKPFETDGKSSGTLDDRWAFTNRNSMLDFQTSASLAAASRTMKGFNDSLAAKCLLYAEKLLIEATEAGKKTSGAGGPNWGRMGEVNAVLQLYITTRNEKYSLRFQELIWPALDKTLNWSIPGALQAIPYMDHAFKTKLKDYVIKYKEILDRSDKENPYGVPIATGGWGGNGGIINRSITNYYANKYFPEIIEPEYVFKGLNYIFGCHPYSNISFVSAVGTRSKKVTYTSNRADFRFIAGGIVPGLLLLKPDFLENKEDWPFLWGENECVIDIGASYVFLSNAVNELAHRNK